jgi:hypothetical protein
VPNELVAEFLYENTSTIIDHYIVRGCAFVHKRSAGSGAGPTVTDLGYSDRRSTDESPEPFGVR